MKLYGISEDAVSVAISQAEAVDGPNELFLEQLGFRYPVKVVFVVEGDVLKVVTCYPLKKGKIK